MLWRFPVSLFLPSLVPLQQNTRKNPNYKCRFYQLSRSGGRYVCTAMFKYKTPCLLHSIFSEVGGMTVIQINSVIPYNIYGWVLLVASQCVCCEVRNEFFHIMQNYFSVQMVKNIRNCLFNAINKQTNKINNINKRQFSI